MGKRYKDDGPYEDLPPPPNWNRRIALAFAVVAFATAGVLGLMTVAGFHEQANARKEAAADCHSKCKIDQFACDRAASTVFQQQTCLLRERNCHEDCDRQHPLP